jgi:hypothetical protein
MQYFGKHIPSSTNPIILVMIHVIMFYQNHVILEMEWMEANIVEAKILKNNCEVFGELHKFIIWL